MDGPETECIPISPSKFPEEFSWDHLTFGVGDSWSRVNFDTIDTITRLLSLVGVVWPWDYSILCVGPGHNTTLPCGWGLATTLPSLVGEVWPQHYPPLWMRSGQDTTPLVGEVRPGHYSPCGWSPATTLLPLWVWSAHETTISGRETTLLCGCGAGQENQRCQLHIQHQGVFHWWQQTIHNQQSFRRWPKVVVEILV